MPDPTSAAAAVTTPGAPPSPDGSPAATAAAATPSAWFADEHRALVEAKHWNSANDALMAYSALEKIARAAPGTHVAIPTKPDDAEAWSAFYKAGGRPDSHDLYSVPKALEADPLVPELKPAAHALGLSAKQWDGMMAFLEAKGAALATQNAETEKGYQAKREAALKAEWGDKYDAMSEDARRAANVLIPESHKDPATGIELNRAEILAAMEGTLGRDLTAKILATAATFQSEDPGVTAAPITPATSVEGAIAQKQALMRDQGFVARWVAGDVDARDRMTKLDTIIAGGSEADRAVAAAGPRSGFRVAPAA